MRFRHGQRTPTDANDQRTSRGIFWGQVQPARFSASDRDDPNANMGVGLARLGIRITFDFPVGSLKAGDGETAHGTVVKAEKGELLAVGTPPISPAIAEENFLLVNPIGFAIEDVAAAIVGELPFRTGGDVHGEKIAAAYKCQRLAMGTEGDIFFSTAATGQHLGRSAIEVTNRQLISDLEEKASMIRGKTEARRGAPALDQRGRDFLGCT